jgi:formylglycine-generating enzyme required for sulfatase activity
MNRFLLILCLNFLLGGVALRQSARAEGAFDWSLSTEHGGGWKSFDWFGPYWEGNGTDWIYHHELGWLYRQGATTDSIWLWKSNFGWLWIHKDHSLFAYAHEWGGEEVWREIIGDDVYFNFIQAVMANSNERLGANSFTGWVYFDWAGELRGESILYRKWNFHFYRDGAWNKDEVYSEIPSIGLVGLSSHDTLNLPLEMPSDVLEQLRKAALENRDKIVAEAIDMKELELRGESPELVLYVPGKETPYTGWGKQMYDNGQVEFLNHYKDGKHDGLVTWWYINGHGRRWEANYKDGKQDGLATEWYMNGQRKTESTWKDGKLDGQFIGYYTDGAEQFRVTYHNGEQVLNLGFLAPTEENESEPDSGDTPSGEDAPEEEASEEEEPEADPEEAVDTFTIPDLSLEMLWVEPGTFEIDNPEIDPGSWWWMTQHKVALTNGFWLGKHEVTQAQWENVMGDNPSRFKGANRPVEKVSWDDVTSFCEKLNERESEAGRLPAGMAYQLPTEAQWEYACRAGTTTAYAFGNELTAKDANTGSSKLKETTDVGKYPANPWGFHDMHGNVWEWCADWYENYPSRTVSDPVGPADGSDRVGRGGSWSDAALNARSANQGRNVPAISFSTLGFRLSLRPASK